MMNRRSIFLGLTALTSVAALAACGGTTPLTPAQVVADANGVVNGLAAAVAGIIASSPTLIPADTAATIQSLLGQAEALMASVSSAVGAPSAASVLQQVEAIVNTVLASLATVSAIPAPYSTAIQAAAVILPIIEQFVSTYIPSTAPKAIAAPSASDLARARAALGIATL